VKYDELAHDVAALFEEAQHLSRRPAWASALDWASIRNSRPAGMTLRYPRAEAPFAPPSPTRPPAPARDTSPRTSSRRVVPTSPATSLAPLSPPPARSSPRLSRCRVAPASPVAFGPLVVVRAPSEPEVGGLVPGIGRAACSVCGGELELREGNPRPIHLRAPGRCGRGAVARAAVA
jgi:hypothetical protein